MADLLYTCNSTVSDAELAKIMLFKEYSEGLLIFAVTCCVIYILVGIPANLITIIALARCKKIQNATTIFIMNLACSDMLFCCYNLPMLTAMYLRQSWSFGVTACQFLPLAGYGLTAESLSTILAITVNRYILIVHPKLYPRIYKPWYIAIMVASTWIVSFGVLLPTWFGKWGCFGMDPMTGHCSILLDCNNKSPKTILFIGAVFLPCLLLLIFYLRIFCIVRKSAKRCPRGSSPQRNASFINIIPNQRSSNLETEDGNFTQTTSSILPSSLESETTISFAENNVNNAENKEDESRFKNVILKQLRQSFAILKLARWHRKTIRYSTKDQKVLHMTLTIIVSFWVCYLPITFIHLFRNFSVPPVPRVLGYVLQYLTTCINPVIYVVMSSEYRQAYKSLFTCNNAHEASRVEQA